MQFEKKNEQLSILKAVTRFNLNWSLSVENSEGCEVFSQLFSSDHPQNKVTTDDNFIVGYSS